MKVTDIPLEIRENVKRGVVIPAMPLALKADRTFDRKHQRALLRYYIDAGAGGMGVGVHATQVEIRDPQVNLFKPVLSLASEVIDECCREKKRKILKIAGICGRTEQAVKEAAFAQEIGYHAGLLSMNSFVNEGIDVWLKHCREVSKIIPLFGFYLPVFLTGMVLPSEFWRRFAEIENVLGIKIAPFGRYETLDVVRGICEAGREKEIALYTGNDDHIVLDLLAEYKIQTDQGERKTRIVGGLLAHWSIWTKNAVELLEEIHSITENNSPVPAEMLTRAHEVTDANSAFFDAANGCVGVNSGINELLRRQGLVQGIWCLNPKATLSPGQSEQIDRVCKSYPHLNDDAFVKEHLQKWLSD